MSVWFMKKATEIVDGVKGAVKEVKINECGADGKPYMIIYFYKENEKDLEEPRKCERYKYSYNREQFEFEKAYTIE